MGECKMIYLPFDEIVGGIRRFILWIIVKVMFFTQELRSEACQQCDSKKVLVPGVFYGLNLIRGYQAIGQHFPERSNIVRADYLLGWLKLVLITTFMCIIFLVLWQHLT